MPMLFLKIKEKEGIVYSQDGHMHKIESSVNPLLSLHAKNNSMMVLKESITDVITAGVISI